MCVCVCSSRILGFMTDGLQIGKSDSFLICVCVHVVLVCCITASSLTHVCICICICMRYIFPPSLTRANNGIEYYLNDNLFNFDIVILIIYLELYIEKVTFKQKQLETWLSWSQLKARGKMLLLLFSHVNIVEEVEIVFLIIQKHVGSCFLSINS